MREAFLCLQSDCTVTDVSSLQELLHVTGSSSSTATRQEDAYDAELLQQFEFARSLPEKVSTSVDRLQLQTDSMQSLLRHARSLVSDAVSTTSKVSRQVRSRAFRDYEHVDQPSRLLRKLAGSTPQRSTSSHSSSVITADIPAASGSSGTVAHSAAISASQQSNASSTAISQENTSSSTVPEDQRPKGNILDKALDRAAQLP